MSNARRGTRTLALLTLLTMAVVFAAGWAVGRSGWGPAWPPHLFYPPRHDEDSWLRKRLNLTDDQSRKIEAIWSDVVGAEPDPHHRLRDIRSQRDAAVRALLTPAQRQEYDAIQRQCDDRERAVTREMDERSRRALERTREVLTPTQREEFDRIVREHGRHGPPFMPLPGGPPPPPSAPAPVQGPGGETPSPKPE